MTSLIDRSVRKNEFIHKEKAHFRYDPAQNYSVCLTSALTEHFHIRELTIQGEKAYDCLIVSS